jgi:hypothetical protein
MTPSLKQRLAIVILLACALTVLLGRELRSDSSAGVFASSPVSPISPLTFLPLVVSEPAPTPQAHN